MELLKQLQGYQPEEGAEIKMYHTFTTFITTHENCFERSLLTGHVTASALVADLKNGKVLLLHHKKLNRWLQPGGHCDGNPDTLEVAKTEVFEETGLEIADGKPVIFDIDIHIIPEYRDIPQHLHYDVRYLFDVDSDAPLLQNHETNELKWIRLDEIERYTTEESVLRMIRKIFKTNPSFFSVHNQ